MPPAKKTTAKKAPAPKPPIGDQADAAYEAIADELHTAAVQQGGTMAEVFDRIQPCTTSELAEACQVRSRIAQVWLVGETTAGRITRSGGIWSR